MGKGTEKGTAKKMTAPVSSEQISRTDEFTPGFNEGTFDPHLHDVSKEFQHSGRALPPARQRKGAIRFIGLCGFKGLAHQTHRSIRL